MTVFSLILRQDLYFALGSCYFVLVKKELFRIFGLGQDTNMYNKNTAKNCFSLLMFLYCLHFLQKMYTPRLIFNRFFTTSAIHNYFKDQEFDLEDVCSVCYENFSSKVKIQHEKFAPYLTKRLKNHIAQNNINLMCTPCNHKFHAVCLLNSISYKEKCPMCRKKLPNIF